MDKRYKMVYSKRLYVLLAEYNIYPVETMINLTNARLKAWKYIVSDEFLEIFNNYVTK